MDFDTFTLSHPAPVAKSATADISSGVALSSRVRLARNLPNIPFPGWSLVPQRKKSCKIISKAIQKITPFKKAMFLAEMSNLSLQQRCYLVEHHFVSRELATRNEGSAVAINKEQDISLMINEEDHLRIQALVPGLQLDQAWEKADLMDSKLEEHLDFAFSPKWGYLTSCPSNIGTGMRASVMLHLPGLVLSKNIIQVIQGATRLGLSVRGKFGEGTEGLSNLFQISNQRTLGLTEKNIAENLQRVILEIIRHELNAREKLLDAYESRLHIYDTIGRAYGSLAHAYSMTTHEALNLISLLRLGYDLGMVKAPSSSLFDELVLFVQPAHILQNKSNPDLSVTERGIHRAELLRRKIHSVTFINP